MEFLTLFQDCIKIGAITMPYQTNSDLPESVRSVLPEAAQSIFREAFNSAMSSGKSEEDSMQIAWAACKNAGYEKGDDGMWKMMGAVKATLANLTFQDISVRGEKGEGRGSVLFDTGASLSFVSQSFAERLGNIVAADRVFNVQLANREPVKIEKMCFLTVQLGSRAITDHFYILAGALADVILGMTTLRKYQIRIEAGQDAVFAEIEIAKEPSMWKKFLALLGISVAEEVTEEKAAELIKGKLASAGTSGERSRTVASKGVLTILGLAETANEDEVKGKILALQNRGDVVPRAEHEQLLARVKDQEIEQVIAAAMQGEEAKLTPAMKAAALEIAKNHGIDTLKNYLADLPKLGIFAKLPEKKPGAAGAKIDDTQAAINRQLGLSQETFLKYNA